MAHDTETETGPVDERWSINDVALLAVLFGAAATALPIIAYLEGGITGWMLLLLPLTVVFGYESGIIPQLKWEAARRIRGD
ncbi:hypothetical protein [Natronorubrum texcoconense]|uniref:Uncharacterized protein n=1 Tax=Natronorubrum texcoconense TaxID=1095776 RepID=A0A1G9H894_9EURY|nr:hypothetical protein [Natronorubrum texcoconense]SDL09208.1 hypothetical protein SAMN04515672_0145 [Natronorubrum texcoconense]